MIQQAIAALIDEGRNLTYGEAAAVMREIMTGEATPPQVAGYIAALRIKGESVEEIAASAAVMREVATPCPISADSMDIVGTGGDKSCSFNISTCAAFVVAAGGVKVAKHGNKCVSSKCGAADVLTELGANLKVDSQKAAEVMEKCGMMFLHAQVYHPAMKYAAPVRSALGVRTIFNILGPLANPAHAKMQLLGVYAKEAVVPLARVLASLGTTRVISVYGTDGFDEVSLSAPTYCCEIVEGVEKIYTITPDDFGLKTYKKEQLIGGEPSDNARIMQELLRGEKGAYRDAVLATAAMAFYLAGKVKTFRAGTLMAASLIDGGRALEVFNKFIEATNS